MKMISSAKMHKAEAALRRLQPYRNNIEDILKNLLSSDATFQSALTETRHVQKITVVIWGSDDGLCGAYNVNLSKFLAPHLDELYAQYGASVAIEIIAVGKKMLKAVSSLKNLKGATVVGASDVDSKSDGEAVKVFEKTLQASFVNKETDLVELVYMNYKSAARQRPVIDQVLPLSASAFTGRQADLKPYLFEPDAQSIFDTILPMYLLALIQEVFVENQASEQAARVMAMQSANDNAKKLLDQLRLEYNKLRQQSITTELLDIVGGQVRD